jgi:hypothetical protein
VVPTEPVRLRPPTIRFEFEGDGEGEDKGEGDDGEGEDKGDGDGGETEMGVSVGIKNSTVSAGFCWYARCLNSRRKRIELLK